MALWIMGFGGTVPFGGLAGGWLIEQTSIAAVLAGGGLVAVALAAVFDYQTAPRTSAPPGADSPPPPTPADRRRRSARLVGGGQQARRQPFEAGHPAGLHQHGVAVVQRAQPGAARRRCRPPRPARDP